MNDADFDEAREALRAAERAAAAPWIEYPPVPWWHPVFFACYAAGLVLAIGLLDVLAALAVEVVLIAAMGAYTGWYTRKRGSFPRGQAPQPIRRLVNLMLGGAVVLALATWAIGALASVLLAAGFAAVATGAAILAYESAYARAASRVRQDLE